MQRRARHDPPALITSAPESPGDELRRRERRYAWSAVVFIGTFAAAGVLHRETVLALILCLIAMVTLVAAVIGANVHSRPRRRDRTRVRPAAGTAKQLGDGTRSDGGRQ